MSHHVGYALDDGLVVYADYRLPIVRVIRKIRKALDASPPKLPDPLDVEKVAAWARDNPHQVCRMPLDCHHE